MEEMFWWGILDSGYVRLTVNHGDNFIDSETDANIQDKWGKLERCWNWNLEI